MNEVETRLFTVKEVANILNQSPRRVRYQIDEWKIKWLNVRAWKERNNFKVSKKDLLEYLKEINPERSEEELEGILFE